MLAYVYNNYKNIQEYKKIYSLNDSSDYFNDYQKPFYRYEWRYFHKLGKINTDH